MKPKRAPGQQIVLILILCLASVLRFYNAGTMSFSNDELSAINRTHYSSINEVIQQGSVTDGHPLGVEIFEYYWIKLLGDDVFIIRLPFILAGIASVIIVYLLAKKWFSDVPALFTAACLATFQFTVLYSQLARPYSFGLLFLLLNAFYWTQIIFERKKSISVFLRYALTAALCAYTHYFALFDAMVLGIAGLFFIQRSRLKYYLASAALGILLFIPHISFTVRLASMYQGLGWLSPPTPYFIFDHIYFLFNNSWGLFVFICLVVILIKLQSSTGRHFLKNKFLLMSFFLWIIPLVFGFIYSRAVSPILQHPVLYFTFPFLLMVMFAPLREIVLDNRITIVLLLFMLSLSVHLVIIKKYYRTPQFGLFKELAEFTVRQCDTYGEDKIGKVININHPFYIDYYLGKMGRKDIKFSQYRNDGTPAEMDEVQDIINKSETPYFLYGWSNKSDPAIAGLIMKKYPKLIEKRKDENDEIMIFGK